MPELPIKAVIFDCFGVLTTDGWSDFCETYFTPGTERYEEAQALNTRMDRGLIAYTDFIRAVAALADVTSDEARRHIEASAVNQRLLSFIRDELRPDFTIGMLSNAGLDWLNQLLGPSQRSLFDEISLSYQTGIVKPDPRAYQQIAERLAVVCEECVFIDDQARYVAAAQQQGMTGIVFTDTAACIQELKRILPIKH